MSTISLCSDQQMQDVVALLDRDESTGLVRLRGLLAEWPHDPRLHFLNGSLKASNGDFAGAALAMRRSLDIAPDYDLARFQLGFLHLTSGEPVAAQESWGPLFGLPQSSYLRTFVDGLCHMIRDEFPEAIAALEKGVALNTEIPAMNRDMELLLAELRGRRAGSDGDGERDEAPLSATQMLLRQASLKATKH